MLIRIIAFTIFRVMVVFIVFVIVPKFDPVGLEEGSQEVIWIYLNFIIVGQD